MEGLKESPATSANIGDTSERFKKPNFLIVGAAKSGTTALWHYLRQHPEVYMSPRKHTRFFSYGMDGMEIADFRGPGPKNRDRRLPYAVANHDAYHSLFEDVTNQTAVGEASHSYLYRSEAAGRIHAYDQDMKIIAILRNPAERAFSHYNQMVRDGRESSGGFLRALEEEEARIGDNWWLDFHYVQIGLYHDQLRRYYDLFGRDRIRVYLYEDFRAVSSGLLRNAFRFLRVDEDFVPDANIRYNASGIPRVRLVHSVLQRLRRTKPFVKRLIPERQYRALLRAGAGFHNRNLTKLQLSQQTRRLVTQRYFQEDILKLENLIQRDLSAWRG